MVWTSKATEQYFHAILVVWNLKLFLNNVQWTNLNLGWPAGQLKLCFFFKWFVNPEPLVYRCPQTWHSYRFTSTPWKKSMRLHIQNSKLKKMTIRWPLNRSSIVIIIPNLVINFLMSFHCLHGSGREVTSLHITVIC